MHLRRFYGSIRPQDLPGTPVPRKDPPLDVRIAEYTAFLRRNALEENVPLVDGDRVMVLQQTVHVGTLVFPPDLTNISRSATIPFTVLQAEAEQFEGLDVLRIGSAGLEMLKEHGADLVVD